MTSRDLFPLRKINPLNSIKKLGYFDGPVYWYAFARQALAAGFQILGLKAGDKVLVPDYICNVIESAFHESEIKITYYRIKRDLSPDFGEIEKKMDEGTKALLSVNYFGFPGQNKRITEFCDSRKLFFIEDNAHGFLSKDGDRWLGTYGHISITSIRKSFPVPHGAILRINGNFRRPLIPPALKKVSQTKHRIFVFYLRGILNFLLSQVLEKKNLKKQWVWTNMSHSLPDKYMYIRFNKLVKSIVQSVNYESFRREKIKRSQKIMEFIRTQTLFAGHLLYDNLPEGVVPLQIPVVMDEPNQDRNEILTYLNRRHIAALYWPDLPETVVRNPDRFPEAHYFKNNLIHFTV